MNSEYSTGDLKAVILDFRDAVESKFATTDSKLDGLNRDFAVMKSDITVLKYDVGVLKDDVSDLKTDLSEVKAWTKRTDIRLDRLEDRRGRKR